jgi:hypothetical protein
VFDERGKRIDSVLDVIEREKKHEMTLAVSADRMVTSTRKILGIRFSLCKKIFKNKKATCTLMQISVGKFCKPNVIPLKSRNRCF